MPKCGFENNIGSSYCNCCGAKIAQETVPEETALKAKNPAIAAADRRTAARKLATTKRRLVRMSEK